MYRYASDGIAMYGHVQWRIRNIRRDAQTSQNQLQIAFSYLHNLPRQALAGEQSIGIIYINGLLKLVFSLFTNFIYTYIYIQRSEREFELITRDRTILKITFLRKALKSFLFFETQIVFI